MLTQAEENYIKVIYGIEMVTSTNVSTTKIAEKLKTSAASVTDMIQKLAQKNLVNYRKYKGASLSKKGKEAALAIVRKHRLWEVFLMNKLQYSWDEVHELAEQLEHIQSDSLVDKLAAYLDHPTHDPHGEPIPDKKGNITHHPDVTLSSVQVNNRCIVIGIKDSSAVFLKFLDTLNICIGRELKVLSRAPFDKSMSIQNGQTAISISQQISTNLFVKNI